MTQGLEIHAYNRLVNTPFGLLGADENALSFSLGYTLQQCPSLLQWFLKQIGIPGVHRTALKRAKIHLQKNAGGHGITDIDIHLPGHFQVIIEAKVATAIPALEQCQKYLHHFQQANEPVQKLVALVGSPGHGFLDDYRNRDSQLRRRLVAFHWPQLIPECVRLVTGTSLSSEERNWVRNFCRFLDQEYGMKAFTTEVWILAISTEPLWPNGPSHWDIHQKYQLWWDYREHSVRPLYMAFRVDGLLQSIYRVRHVEHQVPMVDRVAELRKCKTFDYDQPATIWHFGDPVPLAKPLRTGAGMYNQRVRCDLDLLLTCATVKEVRDEMSKRRKETV